MQRQKKCRVASCSYCSLQEDCYFSIQHKRPQCKENFMIKLQKDTVTFWCCFINDIWYPSHSLSVFRMHWLTWYVAPGFTLSTAYCPKQRQWVEDVSPVWRMERAQTRALWLWMLASWEPSSEDPNCWMLYVSTGKVIKSQSLLFSVEFKCIWEEPVWVCKKRKQKCSVKDISLSPMPS